MFEAIMVKRKALDRCRSQHLWADAGYHGRPALEIIEAHGYIAHVVSRTKEALAKRCDLAKTARRWVVHPEA